MRLFDLVLVAVHKLWEALMQKGKLAVFISLSVFCSSLYAQFIDTTDITRLLDFVQSETIVVLDLDNTVIQPKQLIGSDQWFRHQIEDFRKKGHSIQKAVSLTLPIYHEVMNRSEVSVVDNRTPQLIRDLQTANIPVMALTSRGAQLKDATARQLNSVAVNFNQGRFKDQQMHFDAQPNALFNQGIIFADGKHKGEKLSEYLNHSQWHPKRIVFVDDQVKNVHQVREYLIPQAYDVVGIRYGYLDDQTHVNTDLAAIQKEFLHQLLSNDEAKLLLEHRENKLSKKT